MSANTTSFPHPMDQGVISTFKSYYLRNTPCKAIATIVSLMMAPGKVSWKPFGKDSSFYMPWGMFVIHGG